MEIIEKVRQDLRNLSQEKVRQQSLHFFKESIKTYGVRSKEVEEISKGNFAQIRNYSKDEIFRLCDILWQSNMLEESFIACHWTHSQKKFFEPPDFNVFKRWVNEYITNWASCDTFCNHSLCDFLLKYPEYIREMILWARSDNRWVRRASAVWSIIPARQGKYKDELFEIADILLSDKDDMVQKGYGWMLKSASQAHLNEVFEYVMKNKAFMPRTALRYAIEKMPEDMKVLAMKK